MKLLKRSAFALLLAGASTVFAVESDAVSSEAAVCTKSCPSASTADGESTCPVTVAMGKLPKITFAVGDESLCCSEMAKAKSKEIGEPVMFVVEDEKFASEDKAFVALVAHTEKFVNDYATPHTCSVSGNTTIAGESCGCSVKAGEIASKIKSAMSKVSISYKVGDEECSCPTQAATLAKASGAAKKFVIAGEEETTCDITARLNLARAKYKAAVLAMTADATEKSESETVTN